LCLAFLVFSTPLAPPDISTLSLHDALPIFERLRRQHVRLIDDVDLAPAERRREVDLLPQVPDLVDAPVGGGVDLDQVERRAVLQDRKSTRLNSSHLVISYAVFCLKKKKNNT